MLIISVGIDALMAVTVVWALWLVGTDVEESDGVNCVLLVVAVEVNSVVSVTFVVTGSTVVVEFVMVMSGEFVVAMSVEFVVAMSVEFVVAVSVESVVTTSVKLSWVGLGEIIVLMVPLWETLGEISVVAVLFSPASAYFWPLLETGRLGTAVGEALMVMDKSKLIENSSLGRRCTELIFHPPVT